MISAGQIRARPADNEGAVNRIFNEISSGRFNRAAEVLGEVLDRRVGDSFDRGVLLETFRSITSTSGPINAARFAARAVTGDTPRVQAMARSLMSLGAAGTDIAGGLLARVIKDLNS